MRPHPLQDEQGRIMVGRREAFCALERNNEQVAIVERYSNAQISRASLALRGLICACYYRFALTQSEGDELIVVNH